MVLTKLERKALAFYAAHRHRSPTFGEYVPKLALYFLIYTVTGLTVYVLIAHELPGVAFFFGGMLAGALLRDVRRFVLTLQLWSFTASITDWQKVEEFAAREGIMPSQN